MSSAWLPNIPPVPHKEAAPSGGTRRRSPHEGLAERGPTQFRDFGANGRLPPLRPLAGRIRNGSFGVKRVGSITWTQVTLADFSLGQAMSLSTV